MFSSEKGSLTAFLEKQRQLTAVQSVSSQTWDRYLGHFGNWVHYHDALELEGELKSPFDIHDDPPYYNQLHKRVNLFAAWERWKGNVGQTIGSTISGFWKVLQSFHTNLLSQKALEGHGIFLEREAADRCNVSQAKPIFSMHYAAMKKIYGFYTEIDEDGYPIHGTECYTGKEGMIVFDKIDRIFFFRKKFFEEKSLLPEKPTAHSRK